MSVPVPPALADDVEGMVRLGQRYASISPERFVVSVPITPAGCLAARRLAQEGIAVEATLAFSARRTLLATLIARPAFVHTEVGRINAFVAANSLGDGKAVGEKVMLEAQLGLWRLREQTGADTARLIAAGIQDPKQAIDLAGVDVLGLSPPVAEALHDRLIRTPLSLPCFAHQSFEVRLFPGVEPEEMGLSSLWELSDSFCRSVRRLTAEPGILADPRNLAAALEGTCGGAAFRSWIPGEQELMRHDGQVPRFARWQYGLRSGTMALDDVLASSELQYQLAAQQEIETHLRQFLS